MLKNIDLEKKINSELNTKVSSSKIVHETLNVSIEKDDLKEVLLFLKTNPDMKFKQLIDITAVDYPNRKNRFRKAIKKMNILLEKKDKNEALKFLPKLNSELMKIAKTGIIKKKNASRNISRITKKINNL